MKSEFEARIGKTVSQEEYEVIDKVYTFHPAFSETKGKDEIAELYNKFGFSVIQSMVPVADAEAFLDGKERLTKNKIAQLEKELADISATREALKGGIFNPYSVAKDVVNGLSAEEEHEEER